jgi:hypothetical protein
MLDELKAVETELLESIERCKLRSASDPNNSFYFSAELTQKAILVLMREAIERREREGG